MGKMKNVVADIREFLETTEWSDQKIADHLSVPVYWVREVAEDIAREDEEGMDYDDSMDGDHASALASAGFGTDEDYGYADEVY